MSALPAWRVEGSYYEACNCHPICPCRRTDGFSTGRSSYRYCQFVLSWWIKSGHHNGTGLDDMKVVMIGYWDQDLEGVPWYIKLYVDERADERQFAALSDIFLGHGGGNLHFTARIAEVLDVQPARIELDHTMDAQWIKLGEIAQASVERPVDHKETVTCGITGHDKPGQEYICSLKVEDEPFQWKFKERCGFASNFSYWNDEG